MNKLQTLAKKRADFDFDGVRVYVLSLGRSEKNELTAKATKGGKLDNDMLECLVLSRSVFDADSGELIGPALSDWSNVEGYVSGPLISAVMRISGFDSDEFAQYEKKSETVGS